MTHLNLQRLSSKGSDSSNHSKKLSTARDTSKVLRRDASAASGSSDDTATASNDASEEETLSQDSRNRQGREESGNLIVRVEAALPSSLSNAEEANQQQTTIAQEDESSSDTLEGSSSTIPLQGVPQTPEEVNATHESALGEEEKKEEQTSSDSNGGDSSNRPQHLLRRSRPPLLTRADSDGDASWDMETADVLGEMPSKHYQSTTCLSKKLSLNSRRSVEFSNVYVREYNVCIGDNPCCGYGPPLSLDWGYEDKDHPVPLDVYEQKHLYEKARRSLVLTYAERRARLWKAGYSLEEIDKVSEELERRRWRQSLLGNLEPFYRFQEMWVLYFKPVIFPRSRKRRELDQHLEYVEQLVREEHSLSGGELGSSDRFQDDDLEASLKKEEEESKELLIEGVASLLEQQENVGQTPNDNSKDYGIQVDKKQHDKATEIIFCSLQRPHMRAFHASWFSFSVAFFTWFSIAPLLSEVQESLGLEKADIWMSSLFGTAGTIVFRILMGPMCDMWGARVCMSMILVAAAIPTALTGLVNTSAGLSLVRLFIGIGGSSFVACQYWTSAMFTRETAGTANATAAGWGNCGGGVANLVMGSAIFPLFRWFYSGEDDDDDNARSSELAWRTVFVIPALLSIVTALVILFYCDDSPTGSYQDRKKNESLVAADPADSLRKAAKNWNVWILTLQYACCFGVEVTMTNATALYFKDEFGQSTVSAAGIASIFGLMNIWARGFGGYISDKCQHKYGVKGRLSWQILTLILEGVGVGVFGIADSLAGSIIALIFLSCMVQGAEGSTFGIVPYVSNRYTGSVVGIVGSGGNAGAAIFAVFFVYFSYSTAFVLVGLSAVLSAFLSFLMKTEKLAKTYEQVALEVEQRKEQEDAEEGVDLILVVEPKDVKL